MNMDLPRFETEHYFARYEFSAPHLLSASDCETLSVGELLALANVSLEDLAGLELGYTETQGNPALREAIAAGYEGVTAEEVIVLSSPIEGIYLTMRSLLEPGDEAIVLTPAYDALLNLPEHVSGAVRPWALVPTETGWALDFEHLEALITPKTKLISVNFPHNPTGFLPSTAEFERLLEVAREKGIWLYSDEMYRGLEFGETPRLPSACERFKQSVTLSGLSKTHGLPGLRAGWLVVPDRALRERLLNWKLYTSICPSAPSEFLAQAALSVQEKLTEKNRTIVRDNLALSHPFFARWRDLFVWRPPLAGSTALIELTGDLLGASAATDYCHALAQTAGVVLLPGAFLGYKDTFVRFGFGRSGFEASLNAYDAYLQTHT